MFSALNSEIWVNRSGKIRGFASSFIVSTLASLNLPMVGYKMKIDNLLASNGWKCGLSIATILKGM
jgi:hypothetical protein